MQTLDEIMNLFDSQKGQIEGQIPIIDASKKQLLESDIIDAFEDSIVQYFNDIEIDQDFLEDLEFQQRLEQLQSSQKDQTQDDEQNQSDESESETEENFESNEIEEQPLTQEQKKQRRNRNIHKCIEKCRKSKTRRRRKKITKSTTLDEILTILLTNNKKTTEQLIEECMNHEDAPGLFKELPIQKRVRATLISMSYLNIVEFNEDKNEWSLKKKDKSINSQMKIHYIDGKSLTINDIFDTLFRFPPL
ncbi:hypothetical protein M9Y10_004664 [Tritrichomonas musculus]|uniref:Uncharacterized protein n=1 Tax=Tritrichomonas musculus TaxID=1915356 RepID=A0ABR2JKD7_9EUKA